MTSTMRFEKWERPDTLASVNFNDVAVKNGVGLVPIVPTSVTLSGGTQTTSSTGLVTFSNSNMIQLDGVFTSDFENYRIFFRYNQASAHDTVYKLCSGGAVESMTYLWTGNYAHQSGTNGAWVASTQQYLPAGYGGAASANQSHAMDVFSPANPTWATKFHVQNHTWNTYWAHGVYGAFGETIKASDGIRYYSSSGVNLNGGIIQVFGYNS